MINVDIFQTVCL